MPTALCPECDADVHIDADAATGANISCDECGAELELVGLDPFELDLVDEDDYDDYDDDDEDDNY